MDNIGMEEIKKQLVHSSIPIVHIPHCTTSYYCIAILFLSMPWKKDEQLNQSV